MSVDSPQIPNVDEKSLAKMVELIMCQGYTFGDAFQVTDEMKSALYAYAYDLQKREQYSTAETVFEYLCFLDHYESSSWVALGFCREKLRNYKKALQAYVLAGTLDIDNPIPSIRAAECLMQMGELEAAKDAVLMAIENSTDEPHLVQRKDRAEFLLKIIEKRMAKEKSQ
ncbi:SycD/LcrH family type III secretion system chaperone [Thalassoglobus sp. JC818]|uniref:SycD/LcrH family type III secretion system chaperone n=1 Tax=Thalassoglobus sp. JC818 TaxID=3232136 RepID=UPI003459A820